MNTHYFTLVVSVLICLITTFTVLLSVVTYYIVQEGLNTKIEVLNELSVYCEDLSLSPDEDQETFDIKRGVFRQAVVGDRYICSTDNVTELVHKFAQRLSRLKLSRGQDTREHYLSCGNSSLAQTSGYLSVTYSRITNTTLEGAGENGIVYWDTEHPSSYKWSTFVYNNGGVVVSELGKYFISVNVMFHLDNITETEAGNSSTTYQVYVRVYVERMGQEEIAMQAVDQIQRTYPKSATSLHTGSHVFLRKGDVVRVRVSDTKRLIQESKGNAFGLMPSA